MSALKYFALAGAFTLALTGVALGAGPVYDSTTYDWNGFYAGVFGVSQTQGKDTQFGIGALAGLNAKEGNFLIGAEAMASGLNDHGDMGSYAQIVGRAGVVLGDQVLLYGAAGFGSQLDAASNNHLLLGGGVEMPLSNNVTIRGQYLYGVPVDGSDSAQQVTLGTNFHF